jgi:hypothetical protein
MRALTGLLVLAALAALPASARAQETPMCTHGTSEWNAMLAFQSKISPYLSKVRLIGTGADAGGEAKDAVQAVLGPQFTYLWLDNQRLGWSVAFSPGAHDATSARAAFRAALVGRLTPAEIDYLDSTLLLLPTPHALADLEALRAPLFALMQSERGLFSSLMLGCDWSDGVRVQVGVGESETPELRARTEALLAPYGDKVRVRYGQGWPQPAIGAVTPEPQTPAPQQRPTLKVRDYVSLPRTSRCVRGGAVSAKPRVAGVERVRLAVGKRSVAARSGRTARLRLKSKRSQVTVTVILSDGASAIEHLTYRRCA